MKFKLKIPKKKSAPHLPIPKDALQWLIYCLFMTIAWHLWHIPEIPLWALVAAVPMGIFSYRRLIKEKPLPSPFLRVGLTIIIAVAIFLFFGSPLGRDPGMTALILLSSLKLMELKSQRDFMLIIFMCYFLIFGNFLYDQSILDLAFMVLAFIFVNIVVLRLNHPINRPGKFSFFFKQSFRIFLFSLPLTVVLFLFFPRTYGAFLNLSQDSNQYTTGFSDSVFPGNVSKLAHSNAKAFKVEFPDNNMPAYRDLYFRGLVLWYTDGKGWYHGKFPSRFARPSLKSVEGITQWITLYPHNKRWLFALDRPVQPPRYSRTLPGNIIQSIWRVRTPSRYRVISRSDAGSTDFSLLQHQLALRLPKGLHPGILELAQKWRENSVRPLDILIQAERYFKENGFVYTLAPGEMDPKDPLGDFLFVKRRGFCEHFAASLALLMRAAGVPARVVLGYQGGEFNPIGNYLEIRQRDAHSWVEIWLEESGAGGISGWQRVDPTGWISPDRIQYGLEVSMSISDDLQGDERDQALELAMRGGWIKRTWKFFKNHWENLKYRWDTWIISYDIFRQRNFLNRLGIRRIGRFKFLILIIVLVLIIFKSISILLKRRRMKADPLQKTYLRFCLKLERSGLQRLRWEGPKHLEQRAIQKFPQKSVLIHQITDLFVHLRYGKLMPTKENLKRLKYLVSQY